MPQEKRSLRMSRLKFADLDTEHLDALRRSMLRHWRRFGSKLAGGGDQNHLSAPKNYLGLPLVAANRTHL
jgi:hypothetical protein